MVGTVSLYDGQGERQNTIYKRLCCSGMRWKETGAAVVLSLRTLVLTPTRWSQFWNKLNQYGFPTLSSL